MLQKIRVRGLFINFPEDNHIELQTMQNSSKSKNGLLAMIVGLLFVVQSPSSLKSFFLLLMSEKGI
jgi:hypothetical protein